MENRSYPLEGIRVVELGTHVAVPNATRFMADWGAEVIKVENFRGDEWRIVGRNNRCPIEDDENPFFTLQNANKKFIGVNLKHETGMKTMLELIGSADVFISNVRLLSLKKLGLDYETLSAKFPGLVYTHFTGYGYEGPDAAKPGFDSVAFWARSGAMGDWIADGDYPFLPNTGAGDATVASILCSGILAALLGKQRTGKGTFLSSSLLGSAIWYCGSGVVSTQFGNVFPKDKTKPSNPFGCPYQCGDGEWLMIGVLDYNGAYPKLCQVLGIGELAEDERFSSIINVRQNLGEFMPIVKKAFLQKDRDAWLEEIGAINVVCGPIGHMKDLHTDPQALANGYVKKVTYPSGNSVDMPTVPVMFSAYDAPDYKPSGAVGRDTEEVLRGFGYSDDQIKAAQADGAIK